MEQEKNVAKTELQLLHEREPANERESFIAGGGNFLGLSGNLSGNFPGNRSESDGDHNNHNHHNYRNGGDDGRDSASSSDDDDDGHREKTVIHERIQ